MGKRLPAVYALYRNQHAIRDLGACNPGQGTREEGCERDVEGLAEFPGWESCPLESRETCHRSWYGREWGG